MRTVEDRKLRRLLFARITERLADLYRAQVQARSGKGGWSSSARSCTTGGSRPRSPGRATGAQPVLKQHSCPYYELAEVDHAICALERKMFEKVLGRSLRLSQCRLDGHRSCDFEAKPILVPTPAKAV